MYLNNEIKNNIFTALCVLFGLVGVGFLLIIICSLIYKGILGLSPAIFTLPTAFGGLANAILGQIILVFMASVFGLFIGSFAGIYISE